MKKFDVIAVGDYCLDFVFTNLPGMPVLGKEIVSGDFALAPGGAFNTAAALHRLGVKVAWAADFGNDLFSQLLLQFIEEEGMDTSLIVRHNKSLRKITVSLSYEIDRAFVAFYDPDEGMPAGIQAVITQSTSAVFIPGLFYGTSFDALAPTLHLRGIKILMDGNSQDIPDRKRAAVKRAIRSVDLFLPNASEALCTANTTNLDQASEILGKNCKYVVIKDGSRGAYAVVGGEKYYVPAIPVTAKDTTGAGDVFNAGFICAWLAGMNPQDCLKWGNISGGLSTLECGGTGKRVTKQDIAEWMHYYREQ